MRITIWDMDFYHKLSFKPNIKVMKLSSFHKQQQHIINFVNQEEDLSYDFDLIYIVKEHERTPFPPSYLLDHEKSKLVGPEFKIFPNYFETSMVVDMVRPDYSIYQLQDDNIYQNANMIQMLHQTTKLPMRQSEENIQISGRKINVITDKLLWQAEPEIIIEVLDELSKYKNILFEHPIELKAILSDKRIQERFTQLSFAAGVNQPFRNNYGYSFTQARNIIDLLKDIKTRLPHVRLGVVSFKTVIYSHWGDLNTGIQDLERCLAIMDYAKKNKITIRFRSSKNRLITPYWPFFEVFDIWTEYHKYKSFVQVMLEPARRRQKLQWYEVLNNPKKWYSPRAEFLLHLIVEYPTMIRKYGFRMWGDRYLPIEQIDIKQISQYAFIFDQEDVQAKLQKELIGDEAVVFGHRDDRV